MKKKLLILGGIALGIIVIFVILCFTLFGLSTVTVDFRTSTVKLAGLEKDIVESGEFHYGGSVLFMGKKGAIQKIEAAFPYAKVVNIETVFPSKYVVHIAERQEVYAVQNGENYFITDEEFKVLNVVENIDEEKAIKLSGLEIENKDAEKGDVLKCSNAVDIYSAFLQNNRALHEQRELIESITLSVYEDVQSLETGETLIFTDPAITFKMKNGQTYLIKKCTYGLSYKLAKMLSIYSSIYDELIGTTIAGEERVWTEDLISRATIEIGNKYSPSASPTETTYKVIPPQNV